ncbi:hypothetical protein IKG02_01395, partial [Candidatus Saccharibacteria bacterium]|nr:hypothetical protein [Candidatus Saccharibacteria bacterium]
MQKTEKKLGKIKETIVFGRALRGSCIALAVFVLAFIFLPYIIAEASATNDVSAAVIWDPVSITLDPDVEATSGGEDPSLATHGDVEFGTITPSERNTSDANYGTMKLVKKKIGVTTTGKYYSVYLSMANGETTNGLVSDVDSFSEIPATTGTWSAPAVMNSVGWGVSVPNSPTAVSGSGFVAPDASLLDKDLTVATGGTYYSTSKWAAVPTFSAGEQQIWKNNSLAGGSEVTENFDVYYATMIDTSVLAGTYENEVVYTAVASTNSLDKVSTNVNRAVSMGGTGEPQSIVFDLAESALSSSITSGDVDIYVVPHDTVTAAKTGSEYDISAIAANKSNYGKCNITSFTIDEHKATAQCEMPATTDGVVDDTGTDTHGKFDFWVNVKGYNFNYVSEVNSGATESFAYVGLQSMRDANTHYVDQMQQMTSRICDQTYRWGKSGMVSKITGDNGVVDGTRGYALLYDYNGTDLLTVAGGSNIATTDATTLLTNGANNGAVLAKGTFTLKDTRDGKRYVVRRQADGECWMAQNLNLDLYSGMTFTSADTDLNGKDTWTLASEAVEAATEPDPGWTFGKGSTRAGWQRSHGVETVTLKQYTKSGDTWGSTTVAACSGGTQQEPCYARVDGAIGYFYDNNGTETAVTAAKALADGYSTRNSSGSMIEGFMAGAYYAKITFQVRKMDPNTGGHWTSYLINSNGEKSGTTSVAQCTMRIVRSGSEFKLYDNNACVVETTGDPVLTQFGKDSGLDMNGYGMTVPNITKDADGATISDFTISNATATDISFESATSETVVWPFSSHAGDWRWERKAGDGVHVYDFGPYYYTTAITDTDGAVTNDGDGSNLCGGGSIPAVTTGSSVSSVATSIGTVSGTLVDPATSQPYSFVTCTDGNGQALANSQVDGNWYNFYAATAGSTITNWSNEDAVDSICPLGWQLPRNSG